MTSGQLHTAFLALDVVAPENSIAIFNFDSLFKCPEPLEKMRDPYWHEIIPCSIEGGSGWSCCKISLNPKSDFEVTGFEEEKRISEFCSVGFYFFRDQNIFRTLAKEE